MRSMRWVTTTRPAILSRKSSRSFPAQHRRIWPSSGFPKWVGRCCAATRGVRRLRGDVSEAVEAAAPARRDDFAPAERLRVTEIFLSIQGESASVGWPTVFVRLTGCPLRCRWCDTDYAFHGGGWWGFDQIEGTIRDYGVQHVCITGGEPLAQHNTRGLIRRLADRGYAV